MRMSAFHSNWADPDGCRERQVWGNLWGNLPHSLIARVVAESRRKADSQMPKKLGLEDQAEFVSRFSVPPRQA